LSQEPLPPLLRLMNAEQRKRCPVARGVQDYFPDAVAHVGNTSFVGNEQHNPGEPMHWAKEKSTDHADCVMRHLAERGTIDSDGVRHSAKLVWRALALLQTELEAAAHDITWGTPEDGTFVRLVLANDGVPTAIEETLFLDRDIHAAPGLYTVHEDGTATFQPLPTL
jgi:hypothetical protein